MCNISARWVGVAIVFTLVTATAASGGKADPKALPGWPIYNRFCLACHGSAGDGRGPAAPYAWGNPRAFSKGMYEWRSTPVGQPPTDDDLRTAIRYGAPGTSMPGFEHVLSEPEIDRVIDVIKAFEPSAFAKQGKPIVIGPPRTNDGERGAYLWTKEGCDKCHGADGRGVKNPGGEVPYDLTANPLRRPRAADDLATRRRSAVMSIATGMAGTPMPGFAGPVSDADIWALADHVIALGARVKPRRDVALDRESIEDDHTTLGAWPGIDNDDARVFGVPIAPQGPAPPQLAPAQASLAARQCARCHAKQAREWQPSVHAAATTWGLRAREADHAAGDCDRCHAPLAEQQAGDAVRDDGVSCAGCHLRNWVRRGPPRRSQASEPAADAPRSGGADLRRGERAEHGEPGGPSSGRQAALGNYPLVEMAIYERSDFCMSCHQLPPRTAVNGKPLLDTYKEWLEGPYMRRGIQCQSCHMPDREHTWLGIHDRETFRQGIRLDAAAHRKDGAVTVVATLANVGAGHYLPTTPTPAVWLRIELVDGGGHAIEGARDELRIGREIVFTTQWQERADTRIAPGEHVDMARAWTAGRVGEAKRARITVEVHPDDYYERLYAERLRGKLPAATQALYEAALARTRASHYIAEQREVAIQ